MDIDDFRNGVFANGPIYQAFDKRMVVILKVSHIVYLCLTCLIPALADAQTPNHILRTTDVPPRSGRPYDEPDVVYPRIARYTLQRLTEPTPDSILLAVTKNNMDAASKKGSRQPKPSDLLLHYNYGAAAVKLWGHGARVLQDRPNLPRPRGPPMTQNNRYTIQKLDSARGAGEGGSGNAAAGGGPGEMVDSQRDQARWDEHDLMLYFGGNTKAAKERHRKKQEDSSRRMEQWRQGVTSISG